MNELIHYLSTTNLTTEKDKVRAVVSKLQATALMISKITGIKRHHVDTYKRRLEKEGKVLVAYNNTCAISGFKANYLTTVKEVGDE